MVFKQFFNSVSCQEIKTNEKNDLDIDLSNQKNRILKLREIEEDIKKHLASETGKDRILAVFNRDKEDVFSPQFKFAGQTAINTGIITFMACYFFGARTAGNKFIEKHKHKTFSTKFNALRTYNDIMMFGGLRFGLRMGIKTGIFTWIFMFSSQLFSTYKNKSSFTDYTLAGALTCGLLRVNLGLKGLVAGSVIGAVIGTVGGVGIVNMLRLQNMTQEERYHQELFDNYSLLRSFDSGSKTSDENATEPAPQENKIAS